MSVLTARLLQLKIAANACRAFCIKKEDTPVYWHAKFPDKKARSFDEMPTVEETNFKPRRLHEVVPQWFKKYGYIVRLPIENGKYTVHTCHFDDFETIYKGDSTYYEAKHGSPERSPLQVLKDYREFNTEHYDNILLAPGYVEYVESMRVMIGDSMNTGIDEKLEKVADDLIELLRTKVGEGVKIELLPFLYRFCFENVCLKFLDKRLGALCGNEDANKIMDAIESTNHMVALMTLDPLTDYAERFQILQTADTYLHSVLQKHLEEAASQSDSKSAVKKISENDLKDATKVTVDAFERALQTVPMTLLMAFYNLARNKDVQVQAQEEVAKYLRTKDSKYCLSDVSPPAIISHIILETLRFHPPIMANERIIKSDVVLGGYTVPKETHVVLHFQMASRLEEFYKDPLKFNPDRFKSTNADRVRIVFGLGLGRPCIGATFATDTMHLILSKMLRNFEFSYEGEGVTFINRVYNKMKSPLLLKVKPLPE